MSCTFCCFQSNMVSGRAVDLGTPISLDLNGNPTTLTFWCMTNSITSKGSGYDANTQYGSSVCISSNGQLVVYARNTTTLNKFYATDDWTAGTIYQRALPSTFDVSGYANNSCISSDAGTKKVIIGNKNRADSFAYSNDLGLNWTLPGFTGSTNTYPDMCMTKDGSVAMICNSNGGTTHYKSTDSFGSWQTITTVTFSGISCYCSSDPSTFFACIVASGSNSKYFTDTSFGTAITYYNSSNPSLSLATSEDGQRALLVSAGNVRYTLNGLSGASATFTNVSSHVSQPGQRCSMSSDGLRACFVTTSASTWDCYYTTDLGSSPTWTSINTAYSQTLHFTSCHMSLDGTRMIMLANEGLYQLYIP